MVYKNLKIGLDIDDVLADFWGAYCEYFHTDKNPNMLKDDIITRNVQQILKNDKNFWLSLKVKNTIDFVPELYCTKRVNSKSWTREWLLMNGFPDRPIYQLVYQKGNKSKLIKGKVDVFVDDSLSNVLQCNKSGVITLLYHTERTEDFPMYKIYELTRDQILDTYLFIKNNNFE